MNALQALLCQSFLSATVGDFLAFAAIILGALLLRKPFSRLVATVVSRVAVKTPAGKHRALLCSLIHKPLEWLFVVVLCFYAFNFIEAPLNRIILLHWHRKSGDAAVSAAGITDHLFALSGIVFTTLLLSRVLDFVYRVQVAGAQEAEARERAQLLPLLRDVLKIILWTLGFFWTLGAVFGVNIPALVTGLGIGGVAIALAAKESIENLLASFTILADKPFVVGDTVRLGTLEGKVERIGFRSTRLRSPEGSLLIVPNKKLIDDNLENLSERDLRKVKVLVPVKIATGEVAMHAFMTGAKAAVEAEPQVVGATSVSVESFTETAAIVAIVYYVSDELSEGEIQAARADVTMKVFALIS